MALEFLSSSDWFGFLNSIRDNPEDHLRRLVAADWLQEHGEEDWAELVRVQCQLAEVPLAARHSPETRIHREERDRLLTGCRDRILPQWGVWTLYKLTPDRAEMADMMGATWPDLVRQMESKGGVWYVSGDDEHFAGLSYSTLGPGEHDSAIACVCRGFVECFACDGNKWLRREDSLYRIHPITRVRTNPPLSPSFGMTNLSPGTPLRWHFAGDPQRLKFTQEEVAAASRRATGNQTPAAGACALRWPGVDFDDRWFVRFIDRLRDLDPYYQRDRLDPLLYDALQDLPNQEPVCNLIAETNAVMYSVDELEIGTIDFEGDECVVTVTFSVTGDQPEEAYYSGHRIIGSATARIDDQRNVAIEELDAELDRGDFDQDGED